MEEEPKFISEEKFEGLDRGSFRRSWILMSHYTSPQANKFIYKDNFCHRVFNQPSLLFPPKRWFFMNSEAAKR